MVSYQIQSPSRSNSEEQRFLANPKGEHVPSPISQLPPEILSTIFIFLSNHSIYSTQIRWNDNLGWLPLLLHVCRHWNTVAISCPSLWTSIHLEAPQYYIKQFLSRSRVLPLSLHLTQDLRFELVKSNLSELQMHHLPRFQSLSFASSCTDQYKQLLDPSIQDRCLPNLTSIKLNIYKFLDEDVKNVKQLGQLLSAERTPNLVNLSLTLNYRLPHFLPAESLTCLVILNHSMSNGIQDGAMGLNILLAALGRTPNLDHLVLDGPIVHPEDHPIDLNTFDPISLSELLHLKIRAPARDMDSLYELLDVPEDTEIHLECPRSSSGEISHDFEALVGLYRSIVNQGYGLDDIEDREEDVDDESDVVDTIFFDINTHAITARLQRYDSLLDEKYTRLYISLSFPHRLHPHNLVPLCKALGTRHLQTVQIKIQPNNMRAKHFEWSSLDWIVMFGWARNLRTLLLENVKIGNFVRSLRFYVESGGDGEGDEYPSFPSLLHLALIRVSFEFNHDSGSHQRHPGGLFGEALDQRKRMGVEIEQLEMFECVNLKREEVKTFYSGVLYPSFVGTKLLPLEYTKEGMGAVDDWSDNREGDVAEEGFPNSHQSN